MADFSVNTDEMSRLATYLNDLEALYSGFALPPNPGTDAFGVAVVAPAYDAFCADFAKRAGIIAKWCGETSQASADTGKYSEAEDQAWAHAFTWDPFISE